MEDLLSGGCDSCEVVTHGPKQMSIEEALKVLKEIPSQWKEGYKGEKDLLEQLNEWLKQLNQIIDEKYGGKPTDEEDEGRLKKLEEEKVKEEEVEDQVDRLVELSEKNEKLRKEILEALKVLWENSELLSDGQRKGALDLIDQLKTTLGEDLYELFKEEAEKTRNTLNQPPHIDPTGGAANKDSFLTRVLKRVLDLLKQGISPLHPGSQRPQGSAASPQNQSRRGFLKTASK